MKKTRLLKKIHEIIWETHDLMTQENLSRLQMLVDDELNKLERKGKVNLTRLENGYVKSIEITK